MLVDTFIYYGRFDHWSALAAFFIFFHALALALEVIIFLIAKYILKKNIKLFPSNQDR